MQRKAYCSPAACIVTALLVITTSRPAMSRAATMLSGCCCCCVQAQQLAGFLSEVLKWEPGSRATAEQMLQHEWLTSIEPLQQ
jgi:hypothetical protein